MKITLSDSRGHHGLGAHTGKLSPRDRAGACDGAGGWRVKLLTTETKTKAAAICDWLCAPERKIMLPLPLYPREKQCEADPMALSLWHSQTMPESLKLQNLGCCRSYN